MSRSQAYMTLFWGSNANAVCCDQFMSWIGPFPDMASRVNLPEPLQDIVSVKCYKSLSRRWRTSTHIQPSCLVFLAARVGESILLGDHSRLYPLCKAVDCGTDKNDGDHLLLQASLGGLFVFDEVSK